MSDRSVRRMFKELGGFAYHIQGAQHLTEKDERARLQYCSRVLSMTYAVPDFFINILYGFQMKAIFTLMAMLTNKQIIYRVRTA